MSPGPWPPRKLQHRCLSAVLWPLGIFEPFAFSDNVLSAVGRAALEGEGGRSGQFQSGCRAVTGDVQAVGGRLLAVGNAVGAGVGVWEYLWGGVRAGVLGRGEGVTPPPPFQAMPWLWYGLGSSFGVVWMRAFPHARGTHGV